MLFFSMLPLLSVMSHTAHLRFKPKEGHYVNGTCSTCPRHSDVVATSRSVHYTEEHTYDTWGAMKAFHATRLDWVYSTNKSFVEEAHRRGLELTLAMNPQCFDTGKNTTAIGRVQNIHGQRLVAPWMRTWKQKRYYGCVNNPDYLRIAFDFASTLLDIGSDGIQHDDPGANGEAAQWNGGDPELSGCYCDHCMAGFTETLFNKLNETERSRLNITNSFNYRELLLREKWNGSTPAVLALRPLFVQYQINSSERYLHDLRQHMRTKAASLGRATSLSCNGGGGGWATRQACDYGLAELSAADASPEGLHALFVDTVPEGKQQVMTMPKLSNISLVNSPAFEVLIRTSIAFAYALGGNMMAPWDIYLPTPKAERYYGLASQYADLYALVRDVAALLDATTEPIPDPRSQGNNSRYQHTLTGATPGHLGQRWRFPFPYTSPGYRGRIDGARFVGVNLPICEALCDADPRCAGVWYFGGKCFTLDQLVRCNTSLRGDSFTRKKLPRNHSVPVPIPMAGSSESDVHVKVRAAPNRSLAVVHIVDWRHALPEVWTKGVLPNNTFPPFQLNISVELVHRNPTNPPCAGLAFALHELGPDHPTSRPVAGVCEGNVSMLMLPSPVPWSILEVRSAERVHGGF